MELSLSSMVLVGKQFFNTFLQTVAVHIYSSTFNV